MSKSTTRRITLYINGKEVTNDIASIKKEAQKLTNELSHMERGSKEYNRQAAKIKNLNGIITDHNRGLRQTSNTLGNLKMAWVAVGAAFYGIMRKMGNFIEMYEVQEKAIKKVKQAIISTNGAAGLSFRELTREASRLQNETIFGDETILNDVTGQFLTFTNITGDTFKKAQMAALDLSTVLDNDLKGSALMFGKALNDPVQGLTALRRVGVAFTEKQKETIKEFAETNRLAEAQAIILKELERQYGGQAKAAAGGIGAMKQAKNAFGDLQETIGGLIAKGLAPLYQLWGKFSVEKNQLLTETFKSANERFADQLDLVTDLTTNLLPLLDRHDILIEKTNKSTTENEELNTIIASIAKTVPGAVTSFDDYGRAISISTDRVKDFIAAQKAHLQYINASAIKETESDLKKINKEISGISPKIDEIEKRGTFKILRDETDKLGKDVKRWGDATSEEIGEMINDYQQLLFERSGMIAHLEKLNGDALSQEIERRRIDAEETRLLEEKKNEYKRKSMAELKKLSEQGDQLAIETLKSMTSESKITSSAYVKLTTEISKAREAMLGFVAAGDFQSSEGIGIVLKKLENSKKILDGINAAGGDVNKFLDDLTDAEQGLQDETLRVNEQFAADFKDIFENIEEDKKQKHQAELDRIKNRIDFELSEEERKKQQKEQLEKDWGSALLQIASDVSDAAFTIAKQNIDNKANAQLSALQKQKENELANKNLTEDQRLAIDEKYRKKEAKIKTEAFRKQKMADILQSTINTALAITRALAAPPGWPFNAPSVIVAGISGALQTAVIAAQEVPQFGKGKYDVIGEEDKNIYKGVPFIGRPRTGIVRRPSLISELGPEMIIDRQTLTRLRPEVINAIQQSRVPQHGAGHYPEATKQSDHHRNQASPENPALLSAINKMNEAVSGLNTELKKGLSTNLNYQDLRKFEKEVDETENKFNI